MNYKLLNSRPPRATLAVLESGSDQCTLISQYALTGVLFEDMVALDGPVITKDGLMIVPYTMFASVMQAYVSKEGNKITVERSGCVVELEECEDYPGYVEINEVIANMNVDYCWSDGQKVLEFIVEQINAGPRKLTPSEEKLSYAKYFHEYWQIPYHERADVKAWAEKYALYQPSTMKKPEDMLHIYDVRNMLDKDFRENKWQEGWTLFEDGSGVMCVKTEFPGTTADAFAWWFAWHPLEDIRYMLWYPPAHYGIRSTLELRKILADPNKSMYEKTHGGNAIHLVYESTQIDSQSYNAARAIEWHPIPFQNIQKRGFFDEDVEFLKQNKITAVCGGTRMLHFFVENEDGTGGTLYTHFWYGLEPDEERGWKGIKGSPDESLIPMIMNIGQHATKEFAQLASILPRIYAEEGKKPLV